MPLHQPQPSKFTLRRSAREVLNAATASPRGRPTHHDCGPDAPPSESTGTPSPPRRGCRRSRRSAPARPLGPRPRSRRGRASLLRRSARRPARWSCGRSQPRLRRDPGAELDEPRTEPPAAARPLGSANLLELAEQAMHRRARQPAVALQLAHPGGPEPVQRRRQAEGAVQDRARDRDVGIVAPAVIDGHGRSLSPALARAWYERQRDCSASSATAIAAPTRQSTREPLGVIGNSTS